jgi:peptidoglycan/xylan/chitin deacetylase (PgdA/CDA1 family)
MRIGAPSKLKRTVRWIKAGLAAKVLILMYHRVAQLKNDPHNLSVTPRHFAEHLEVLRKYTRPMALQQLVLALRDNRIQRRTVVVTLDDGYADNLYNAKPLLQCFDIPATFFVATGYLGSERGFWHDGLERLFLRPGVLPETLRLNIDGRRYQWELADAARYSEESYLEHQQSNGVRGNSCPRERQLLYRSLHQLLRPLPDANRREMLDQLVAWAGMGPADDAIHRTLSPDEVVCLADGDLIEIGAHTVTHPVLSEMAVDLQQSEIAQSKACLEEILGRSVANFAYPYGTPSDYTEQTVDIVREAGFASACSSFSGAIHNGINLYELPRYAVSDWDGETFEWQLSRWFCD